MKTVIPLAKHVLILKIPTVYYVLKIILKIRLIMNVSIIIVQMGIIKIHNPESVRHAIPDVHYVQDHLIVNAVAVNRDTT